MFILLVVSSNAAWARRPPDSGRSYFFWASIAASHHQASDISGATATTPSYFGPTVMAAGVGMIVSHNLYVSLRYQNWKYQHNYSLAGVNQSENVNYQTVGGDLGVILRSDPINSFIVIPLSAAFPIQQMVTGPSGPFTASPHASVEYEMKAIYELNVATWLALALEISYRLADIGPYAGRDFSLSGLYGGAGLRFHF